MARKQSLLDVLFEISQSIAEDRDRNRGDVQLDPSYKRRVFYGSRFKMTDDEDYDLEIEYDEEGVAIDADYSFRIKTKSELDKLIMYLMSVRESME